MNITTEKLYITYEEPLRGRTFTKEQMQEVYRDLADKSEYTTFEVWFADMLKSGVFEEWKDESFIDDEEKMYDFVRLTKKEFLESYSYLTEKEYDDTLMVWNNRK